MAKFRSQTDAPIELVIAIIILLASMSIAYMIYIDLMKDRCLSEMKGEVQKLQLAMQDLALQSPPSTRRIEFKMPTCGDTRTDVLRFVYYSRPEFCRACPGHFAGCWKLELASYNPSEDRYEQSNELYNAGICVDIAGDMVLIEDSSGDPDCQELSDNPCPTGVSPCDFDKSGVLRSVYDPAVIDSPSRWQTLGKKARLYEITLKKGLAVCSAGSATQCPAISICAKPVAGLIP